MPLIDRHFLKVSAGLFLMAAIAIAGCKNSESNTQPAANAKQGGIAAVKSSNPVAYFRLESTNGSSEIGASTFKSAGGVSTSAGAPIGVPGNQCATFNGKDGWIVTTQTGGIGNAGSMMAWVNLAQLPHDAGHFFYVAGESERGNDFDLQFENDNAIRFYTAAGAHLEYKPDPNSLLNQWHMVLVTMDVAGKSRAMYWDGQLVASDQDPGKPNKTSALSMGASTVFGGRYLNGGVDEVALWNRSLTAAEVSAIYNATK